VAKAVAMLMEAIYEQDFCDFSYGYVIDGDISAFFDNLQHDTL